MTELEYVLGSNPRFYGFESHLEYYKNNNGLVLNSVHKHTKKSTGSNQSRGMVAIEQYLKVLGSHDPREFPL